MKTHVLMDKKANAKLTLSMTTHLHDPSRFTPAVRDQNEALFADLEHQGFHGPTGRLMPMQGLGQLVDYLLQHYSVTKVES